MISLREMVTENEPTVPVASEPDLLDTPGAGPTAIRGSVLRTGGYVLAMLLSLVSAPLLIRHLGFSRYGLYTIVISLVTIVQGVTDIGLGQIGVREYATRPHHVRLRLMRNLVGVRLTLTSAGVAIAFCFALLAGYPRDVLFGTLLAGAAMVLTVVQGTFAVPLAAELRLGWVTALELLRQALTVAGIVALVLAGAGLLPFLAVPLPASVIVLATTIVVLYRHAPLRPSFHRSEWVLLMRAVLPFAAAVVIGSLYLRITVVLMSLLSSDLQTGYYSTSFAVLSVLIAIPALSVGSTLPIIARAARDDAERLEYVLERLGEAMLIAGVGLGLTLFLGAGFIVHVLAKGHVAPAIAVLRIQSLAVVTQFVGSALQYGLLALHRHRSLLWASAAGLLGSVALAVVLIPPLQARGGAIAFVAAEGVVLTCSFLFLRAARPELSFSARVPLRVLAAAALAVTVVFIPGLPSVAAAAIGTTVYVVTLLALRALPVELIEALMRREQVG